MFTIKNAKHEGDYIMKKIKLTLGDTFSTWTIEVSLSNKDLAKLRGLYDDEVGLDVISIEEV